MLPNSGFNSYGFSDDVRGFKKRNKPLHLFKTYAPVLVIVELLILALVTVTLNHSINYGNKRNAALEARVTSREEENRNLLNSLSSERQSRSSTEIRLREVSAKLTTAEREAQEHKAAVGEKDTHCQNLQQSFDSTRAALEGDRDAARYELRACNDRVTALQNSMSTLDRAAAEKERVSAEAHRQKDTHHANKEAEWEQMRQMLEAQIRAAGGYVEATPAAATGAHPDYAAQVGDQAFHPVNNEGRKERFIDTAGDLELDGIIDPKGKEHLAEVLGHLYQLKLNEQAAAERNHPVGAVPLPKPPIGHWMATNLERTGVTCKYGIVHMAYILDRHFSLEGRPPMVGRAQGVQTDNAHPGAGQAAAANAVPVATAQGTSPTPTPPPVPAGGTLGRAGGTPGVTDPPRQAQPAQARYEADKERMKAWRAKHHKVDAAGFV